MAERLVGVTDQASGAGVADVRARERTVGGSTVAEQYVIPIEERVPSFRGMAATFRAIGSTATPQWLLHFANSTGSAVLVAVRAIQVIHDTTALTTTVNPVFTLSRTTGTAAGGTALSKTSVGTGVNAAETSAANVSGLGGASGDGTNTPITGLTAGAHAWRRSGNRLHSAAGQVLTPPLDLIPPMFAKEGMILRAAEQLGVTATFAAAADNVTTYHYTVSIFWDEYQLP